MSWEIHAENDINSLMFNTNAIILLQSKLHLSVKHNSITEQTQSAVQELMKSLQFNQLHGEEQRMLSEYFGSGLSFCSMGRIFSMAFKIIEWVGILP